MSSVNQKTLSYISLGISCSQSSPGRRSGRRCLCHSGRSMADNDAFNLRRVAAHFRASVQQLETGERDVGIDEYILGYNELNLLFYKLGRLFSFIADDVKEKTQILVQHRQSGEGDRYELVGRMMQYELYDARLLDQGRQAGPRELPNGSRTLLRLHRALFFVTKLIESIRLSRDGGKMSELTKKAYQETLAPYHSWAVRKMVTIAVMTLPTRSKVVELIAGPVPKAEVDAVMQEVVEATRAVYELVQRLYEHHQLLELP